MSLYDDLQGHDPAKEAELVDQATSDDTAEQAAVEEEAPAEKPSKK